MHRRVQATVQSYMCARKLFSIYLCKDMMAHGASLAQILKAGQWRSAAFMRYLDEADLEKGVALEVACDSDGEIWPEDID